TGPFASGVTQVQVGFQMPFTGSSLTLVQKWPVPLEQVSVASQKLAGLSVTSPQFTTVGDVRADDGTTFILGSGNALPAGGTLTLRLSGLPVASSTPRNVALGLAAGIALLGIWLTRSGNAARGSRARLIARRDTLLAELARIEEQAQRGRETAKDTSRRSRI